MKESRAYLVSNVIKKQSRHEKDTEKALEPAGAGCSPGGDAGARGGSAAREQRWGAPGGAGPGGRPWHRARRPCGGQGPGEAKLTHTQVTELGPRPVKAPL